MHARTPRDRAPVSAAPLAVGLAAALLAAFGAGCATTDSDEHSQDLNWLVQHGHYDQAVRVAEARHRQEPGNPRAAEAWRWASAALVLDEGRQLSFQDRDVEALAKFEEALALAPEVQQASDWREATLDKLATQWVTKAIEWHNSDNLPMAAECYEKALEFRPDDPRAEQGLGRVLIQLNYRRGMADRYYEDGIKALEDYWLEQASHHFSGSLKFDRESQRAKERRQRTDTMRADDRALKAHDLEQEGQFAAARNEYRLATLFDPDHADALAGLERTKKEEKAAELLREASRRISRKQFDEADRALAEGELLTARQQDTFTSERDRLLTARLMVQYDSTRALETDHRFEDAIAGYDQIIALAPQGYFQDALARRDTLRDLVEKATRYYAEAQTVTDPVQKLALLEQVVVVYPEYKDTLSQVQQLRAEQQPPAPEPTPETPPGR